MMDNTDDIRHGGASLRRNADTRSQAGPLSRQPLHWSFRIFFCLLWAALALYPCAAQAARGARAAILVNMDTGAVLFDKNADMSIPPASLTKVMSMFLVLDAVHAKAVSLTEQIRITGKITTVGGSSMHLRAGERVPVDRLLTGAAVASGNDAITALALRVGGNERQFVRAMNLKARALGMKRTDFKNPTGLPAAGQRTTPRDMATLTRAYLRAHPEAQRYHNTRVFTHRNRQMANTNALLGSVRGVNGLKTGWTVASGYNLIVTAHRGNTRLLAVVMGGASKNARDAMAERLIEAGFDCGNNPKKIRRAMGYRR